MTFMTSGLTGFSAQAQRSHYNEQAILSATPVQLLTMLYDRLVLDLHRAEAAQVAGDWPGAATFLLHAQEIITELAFTLKVDDWDGADDLLGLYNFLSNELIHANIDRDIHRTRECIAQLEPLRQAWHEAAASLPAQQAAPAMPLGLAQNPTAHPFGRAAQPYDSATTGGTLGVA